MKYAVLGPQKGINRISATEPQWVAEGATVVQITDEQAALVEAGRTSNPRVLYFFEDGQLITLEQKRAANAPVPKVVGSGQIRAAMILSGIAANQEALDTLIHGAIDAAIADPVQNAVAHTLWDNASEFKRSHEFLDLAQAALNKTDADIDNLFRLAATI